jgi:hypothetical protein
MAFHDHCMLLLTLQAHFQSGVLAAVEELQATYQALVDCQDDLDALRLQNAQMSQRCDEFVKGNLDHMLAWRSLKSKADGLEGKLQMTELNGCARSPPVVNTASNAPITKDMLKAHTHVCHMQQSLHSFGVSNSLRRRCTVLFG